ncbi:hypothetical protein KC363_g5438 [Hortaea werneckii]|uniref:F-box domain-containing protein n=1 Tax=Hortaea werneckii TaxID=91943 RepID=A0A3M7FIX3_HORWE|nr:hypothetical protein KC363_g5438 [Hortaea werneckii]RMY88617.1 hypothetical protein D0861_04686 [Hortaea werneckii]
MEATASGAFAGPSTEATPAAVYEDDSRHCAITASQVPKPAVSALPPLAHGPVVDVKDLKSIGTRFHEDCHETDLPSPRLRSSRMFKGKGKEAVPVEKEKKKPLCLLDLPVDILKDIVKEVTHTNDLTSLALCHSALHRLTTPHIYSRFDIVWPDTTVHSEPRSGVDALTYGLSTLTMAEEVFGEAPSQRAAQGNRFMKSGSGRATEAAVKRRRGNHYAQFTKKFSLGNGPPDWVQEYLITKESGKMLGTLVALAVARMRVLETFVWDMPTGILRDVWLALSSLGDRDDGRPCRLEKVWVRWHDNSSADAAHPVPPPPLPINISNMPPAPLQTSHLALQPQIHPAALDRVEHPSFSELPPLKSLNVLDIDELPYLDEMAVLIGRSLDKLRELRVGIARHAVQREWATVWEGDSLKQIDADYPTSSSVTIGEKRLGGVMGILTGFVHDMRKPKIVLPERIRRRSSARSPHSSQPVASEQQSPPAFGELSTSFLQPSPPVAANASPESLNDPLIAMSQQASPVGDGPGDPFEGVVEQATLSRRSSPQKRDVEPETERAALEYLESQQPTLSHRLRLETLELERVPLSVPVLQKAVDWTKLTSLTLLNCQNNEQLWKTLRKAFAPTARSPTYPAPRRTPSSTPKKGGKAFSGVSSADLEYPLKLKKIHTNTVSPSLIAFLKETLVPNSLEVLFLQEARTYNSSVSMESIFRGPLRRHRNSLKKLLIDSSEKSPEGLPMNSSRWRKWLVGREVLGYICGGKMPALREVGMAIDYRDWHFFLQHLPSIPQLRSLYIPFIADHVHGSNLDPRELALSIMDIVALRPEVEICYMGIQSKCFEILENKREWDGRPDSHLGMSGTAMDDGPSDGEDEDEGDVEDDEDEEDGEDGQDDELDETESDDDADDDDDDDDDDDASDLEEATIDGRAARLRLREILFYDDKVAVFKARHGKL